MAVKAGTISESTLSYARQLRVLREGDGGEAAALIECFLSNTRHTRGEGDGGEAAAIIESIISNARHTIDLAVVGDGRGNSDRSAIIIAIIPRHLYR